MNQLLFVWVCVCTVAFAALFWFRPALHVNRPVALIVATTVLAYGVPLVLFRNPTGLWGGDIENYRRTANAVLSRQDVYALPGPISAHPYLPLQMYAFAFSLKLADATPLTFFTVVRCFHVVAAVVIAILVWQSSLRLRGDASGALVDALSWAVCPLPLLITMYHGQIDIVSTAFAVGAWYTVAFSAPTMRTALLAGLLLGLGIVDKTWPVILLPVLAYHLSGMQRKVAFTCVAGAVVLTSIASYLIAFDAPFSRLREQTTGYRGPANLDGQTLVLSHIAQHVHSLQTALAWEHAHGAVVLFAGIAIVAAIVLPRRDLLTAVIAAILAFYVFTAESGGDHLLWVLPFGIIAGGRARVTAFLVLPTVIYTLVGFVYCAITCRVRADNGELVIDLNPLAQRVYDHLWWLVAAEYTVIVVLLIYELWSSRTGRAEPDDVRAHGSAEDVRLPA